MKIASRVNVFAFENQIREFDEGVKSQLRDINEGMVWSPTSLHGMCALAWITTIISIYLTLFVLWKEKTEVIWLSRISASVFSGLAIFLTIKSSNLREIWKTKLKQVEEFEFKFGIKDMGSLLTEVMISKCRKVMTGIAFNILITEEWLKNAEDILAKGAFEGCDLPTEKLAVKLEYLSAMKSVFESDLLEQRLKLGNLLNLSKEFLGDKVDDREGYKYFFRLAQRKIVSMRR